MSHHSTYFVTVSFVNNSASYLIYYNLRKNTSYCCSFRKKEN